MIKIVSTGTALSPAAMSRAEAANAVVVPTSKVLTVAALSKFVAREQPDAIIVRVGAIPVEVITASKRLRFIAKHGVGYDTIDVRAAAEHGIPVAIAAGANAQSVAEHALTLMLSVARGVPRLDARLRQGYWDKLSAEGVELTGKTLGIIGAGMIGLRFAELVGSLRMRVLAYDPYASAEALGSIERVDSIETLMSASDVVSLHCPLTKENRGLVGARELSLMPTHGILINTARGELVDVAALEAALRSGSIFGAGLDTFPIEPAPADSPLWELPNIVVTPHVGASTREAKDRVGLMAVQQVLDWFEKGAISEGAIVNPDYEDVQAPHLARGSR